MLRKFGKRSLYYAWRLWLTLGPRVTSPTSATLTLLLTNYRRPETMASLMQAVLKCDFVDRVIISNNEPSTSLAAWLPVRDTRVVLVDQPTPKKAGSRWFLAKQEPGSYFMAIDDDVFLFPEQIRQLFHAVVEDPRRPHGIAGKVAGRYVQNRTQPVDTLVQVYAVTRRQVQRFVEIAAAVGYDDTQFGDYLLISQAGADRPMIHRLGFILRAGTANHAAIAAHRDPSFARQVMDLQAKLAASGFRVASSPAVASRQ